MTSQLTMVWLLVENVPQATEFYRDILGFEVKNDFGVFVELHVNEFFDLALYERASMQASEPGIAISPTSGQQTVLAIDVKGSVDDVATTLKAKGVTLVTEPTNRPEWGLRAIF